MTDQLHGLRVLNTRPKHQAQVFTKAVTEAGGISIECPALEIRGLKDTWLKKLPELSSVDYAVFISANAVHHCFKQLEKNSIQWPSTIKVIAIGQSTATALKKHQILSNEIPEFPNSEYLLALESMQELNKQTVLLFKGEGGRLVIEEGLLMRGAQLIPLLVYKRVLPAVNAQLIKSIWQDNLVDIILLTSEQSLENLFHLFGHEALSWLQGKPFLVISDRLAKAASLYGIQDIVISHPQRMINTLSDYSQGLLHGH